jgi:glycosyltransferase involved in cell wall biosynthesis
MAGVGIRYYEIARTLGQTHNVILAAPAGSTLPPSGEGEFTGSFTTYDPSDWSSLREHLLHSDVLFAYPDTIWLCRELLGESTIVVVDGYDLALLEHLELDAGRLGPDEQLDWQLRYQRINQFVLQRGDLFLCATERQRDWWLGALASAGRINALTRQYDSSFHGLIDLLPYGIPERPPTHTRPVMRGVIPGIASEDKIVLWGGGIWQWLDPLTLIRAADLISRQRTDIKFVFPGVHHPAEQLVPRMEVQQQTLELARSLNLLGRSVFTGEWVAYADWQNYLVESDVGVSLHRYHLEAHMSSRTRVLSYVWGDLPMVLTRGDELAEQMAAAGVAQLVNQEDERAVAEGILRAIDLPKGHFLEAFDSLHTALRWGNAVGALDAFCANPHRARDAGLLSTPILDAQRGAGFANPATEHAQVADAPETLSLSLPKPTTSISRAVEPLVRSLGLWYVAAIIDQQNRINHLLKTQLEQAIARHEDDRQKQLAEIQAQHNYLVNTERNIQEQLRAIHAIQEQLNTIQENLALLQRAHGGLADEVSALARQNTRTDIRLSVAETLQSNTIVSLAKERLDNASKQ